MRTAFICLYAFLLAYIAVYGLHLYWLIALSSRQSPRRPGNLTPDEQLPFMTVQLPIYNERNVVERLIEAVAGLDWPRDRFEIQVLDDSNDNTSEIIASETLHWRDRGIAIHHIRRNSRAGYKAGALANGLRSARGEFIAIFDADNVPKSDFLKRLIGYFTNSEVGMVQARWSFLNRQQSLLCRAQALFLDAHFLVEQIARYRGGLLMNFNGTAGIWRRLAIDEGGGWKADTLTEDLDLSFRAQLAGWQMVFDESVDVPTELPTAIRAFKAQQYRWACGAIETGVKLLPQIMRAPLPRRVKIASFFHLTQKTVSPALLLLAVLLIPALYVRMESGIAGLLVFDLPVFLAGTGSMTLFYSLAYRRQQDYRSSRSSLTLPLLTSLGIGLAANNTLAVIAALSGKHGTFVRTPKSGTAGAQVVNTPVDYRIRADRTFGIEIALATYASLAVGTALWMHIYPSVPFLLTFAFGFTYFAVRSLKEAYA